MVVLTAKTWSVTTEPVYAYSLEIKIYYFEQPTCER